MKELTKFQALFIKYLATRMCCYGECKGTSFRNIAMYFSGRYSELGPLIRKPDKNKKWWEQNFITSQIDGLILIDMAAACLNDYNQIKDTNWKPTPKHLNRYENKI